MLKNPPISFKKIINTYFKIKGNEILEDLNLWIERSKVTQVSYEGMAAQNQYWCDVLKKNNKVYENNIVKGINELKELINNIKI